MIFRSERFFAMGLTKRVVYTTLLCAIAGFIPLFINIVHAQVIPPYKNPAMAHNNVV